MVVTGPPEADVGAVASALAERLGLAWVSVDGIQDEIAAEAEDTPRDWLRLDAEREAHRRLEALAGAVVLDLTVTDPADLERAVAVLRAWWHDVTEVRCVVPGHDLPGLGAPRTVVLDGTRPAAVGEVAAVVKAETPTVRRVSPR